MMNRVTEMTGTMWTTGIAGTIGMIGMTGATGDIRMNGMPGTTGKTRVNGMTGILQQIFELQDTDKSGYFTTSELNNFKMFFHIEFTIRQVC